MMLQGTMQLYVVKFIIFRLGFGVEAKSYEKIFDNTGH